MLFLIAQAPLSNHGGCRIAFRNSGEILKFPTKSGFKQGCEKPELWEEIELFSEPSHPTQDISDSPYLATIP